MNEKFSIIIPVYNGEKIIKRSIESVLNLDYQNWELIIINDGSKDDTKEICEKFLYDPRIKLINKKNEGVSIARNTGIKESRGEYIIFLDADDFLSPDICDIFLANIENTDFIIAGYYKKFENNVCEIADSSIKDITGIKNMNISDFSEIFGILYKENFINSPWAKCYKRKVINEGFNSEYTIGEDLIFNLNYIKNCKNICIIFQPVYFYNIQLSGSLSSSLLKNGFENLFDVYKETIMFAKSTLRQADDNSLNYINEKYVLDMMIMLERNIRYNEEKYSIKDVQKVIEKYELREICEKISKVNFEKKWKIGYKIINRNQSSLYYYYIKILYFIHKIKVNVKNRRIKWMK